MFPDRSPLCLLEGIVASKIGFAILKQSGISVRNETAGSLNDAELDRIARTVFRYRIIVNTPRGMDYAQVTAGGADCAEFNPETMESRIVPGIHATGEVLNVDGDCGGFNLMFAFTTGLIAGEAV